MGEKRQGRFFAGPIPHWGNLFTGYLFADGYSWSLSVNAVGFFGGGGEGRGVDDVTSNKPYSAVINWLALYSNFLLHVISYYSSTSTDVYHNEPTHSL